MFRRKQDKEVDLTSLNDILRTGKKIIRIGYIMAIVCLVLLGTYIIKEWHLLNVVVGRKKFLYQIINMYPLVQLLLHQALFH